MFVKNNVKESIYTDDILCFRIESAAKYISCSTSHIKALIKDGSLEAWKLSEKITFIYKRDLIEYVDRVKVKANINGK
ncbi:MerR family transcriptional regulator [Arcobacter peruensis]|uniref:hypothetical protein n=1 Tax=Arcobacter peruensis TaxID=2320140 RepID=UPI000F097061|nr:hypothetical protein [Arcobacter peruensis]